jgi:hypothetical protein
MAMATSKSQKAQDRDEASRFNAGGAVAFAPALANAVQDAQGENQAA